MSTVTLARPEVSFIVPSYINDAASAAYLLETIRSITAQTDPRWEALIVNDGSRELLEWCGNIDPRVTVINQDNKGVSAARNHGVAKARAGLVAFVDSDDVVEPKKLELQLPDFDDPNVIVSGTNFRFIDENGAFVYQRPYPYTRDYTDFLRVDGVLTSTVMARKADIQVVGGFDETMPNAEDWKLMLALTQNGTTMAFVEDELTRYRLHPGGASRHYRATLRYGLKLLLEHREAALNTGDTCSLDAIDQGLRDLHIRSGYQAMDAARASGGIERFKHLWWVAWHNPKIGIVEARHHLPTRRSRVAT